MNGQNNADADVDAGAAWVQCANVKPEAEEPTVTIADLSGDELREFLTENAL